MQKSTFSSAFSSASEQALIVVGDSKGIIGPDGRQTVLNPLSYPFSAVGRVVARWKGNDGILYTADDLLSGSSGALISRYQVLTAGHSLYNKSNGGFADVIEFIPGSSGRAIANRFSTDSYAASNEHYGRAKAVWMTTFSNWSNQQDLNWDMGVITLDRNIGNYTGWMGYGFRDDLPVGTVMNVTGYPGDRFDPDGDGVYDNYNMSTQLGQITRVTPHQLQSNQLDYVAGNSGGPVWLDSNQVIYGVVSHSNLNSSGLTISNNATRIDKVKYDTIGSWLSQDDAMRPPVDRPDLVDYDRWFATNLGGFSKTTVRVGETFRITAYPRNNGTAPTGIFNVTFYASTDRDVTNNVGSHWIIGTVNIASLNPFNWGTATWNGSFPTIPMGNYNVIAFFDPNNAISEFDDSSSSNQKVFNQRLTIQPRINNRAAVPARRPIATRDTLTGKSSVGIQAAQDWPGTASSKVASRTSRIPTEARFSSVFAPSPLQMDRHSLSSLLQENNPFQSRELIAVRPEPAGIG